MYPIYTYQMLCTSDVFMPHQIIIVCHGAVCDPIPSQATSVRNLTSKPLVTVLCAMSVVNFGHVRPREEPGRICWTVTLGEMVEHIDL